VVVVDRNVPDAEVDLVRVDSEEGAYDLIRYLLELGHERICLLSGPESISTAKDRINGFRRAMKDARMDVPEPLILSGNFTQQSGYEMTIASLESDPAPTALFAGNNFIAIGALRALRERNIRVPEDIALVAVDDIPPDFMVSPFLTVAQQPAQEMGKLATQLLLDRIQKTDKHDCRQIILKTKLLIRRSSGEPIAA
jgi:LacI family transcriptional regulator